SRTPRMRPTSATAGTTAILTAPSVAAAATPHPTTVATATPGMIPAAAVQLRRPSRAAGATGSAPVIESRLLGRGQHVPRADEDRAPDRRIGGGSGAHGLLDRRAQQRQRATVRVQRRGGERPRRHADG